MIPRGKVLSYGAVAALAGRPRAARAVGAALSALPEGSTVPWWRVINHSGRITTPKIHHIATLQSVLLQKDGIPLGSGRVDMARHAWQPNGKERRALADSDGPESGSGTMAGAAAHR